MEHQLSLIVQSAVQICKHTVTDNYLHYTIICNFQH